MLVPVFALAASTRMYWPFQDATSPAKAAGARHNEPHSDAAAPTTSVVLRGADMEMMSRLVRRLLQRYRLGRRICSAAGTAEISAGSRQAKSPSAYTLIPGHSTWIVLARAVLTSSSSTWVPFIALGKKRTSFVRVPALTMVMSSSPSEGSASGQISSPPP